MNKVVGKLLRRVLFRPWTTAHFKVDRMPLVVPKDNQIQHATTKTIFAFDAPPAIDDPLQECHQYQIGNG